MSSVDTPYLAANYSPSLAQVLPRCAVDFVKVPTVGTVDEDFGPASQLGLRLLLHNAHVNVQLADADLMQHLDLARFREVIRLTDTPHLSFHLDAEQGDGQPEDLVDVAVRNVSWLIESTDRPVLVETPCFWQARPHTRSLAVPEGIGRILADTDAGMLFDVSHVRCSAYHLGCDEDEYIRALPLQRVHEIHMAGSRMVSDEGRLDVHAPLEERDYEILLRLLDSTPARFVTLEYGGRTAGSAEEFCRRFGIDRNDPDALEDQLARLAAMLRR